MIVADNILKNPIKGSSHMAPRNLIISSLTQIYYQSIELINFISCYKKDNKSVRVHLKIGSREFPNVNYDVLFEFLNIQSINGEKIIDGVFQDKTEMKVFSNSPEFIFTYAYVFNTINALIPDIKHFLGGKALGSPPKIKNPTKEVGISTSLFIGLKYLEMNGFFGNYNYAKFINGIKTEPLPFHIIQKNIEVASKKIRDNKVKKLRKGKK